MPETPPNVPTPPKLPIWLQVACVASLSLLSFITGATVIPEPKPTPTPAVVDTVPAPTPPAPKPKVEPVIDDWKVTIGDSVVNAPEIAAAARIAKPGTYDVTGYPKEGNVKRLRLVVSDGTAPPVVVVPDPPKPDPKPVDPVIPQPVVGMKVLILYDKQGNTDKFNDVILSAEVESYLNEKCGKDGWYRWDDEPTLKGMPELWKQIYAACKPHYAGAPTLFVIRGQAIEHLPLPDEVPAALATLKRYGG